MEQLNLKLTLNKNGSITANWSPITGAVRYHVHMVPVGKSYMIYNEKNITATSYTSRSNLDANQQYQVVLVAYSSSKTLADASAKVLIPIDFYRNLPLTVPQNVKATADTVSVTVSFDAVDNARSYDILFDNTVYNVTTTFKKFTGLQPKTSHTYAVRAKNTNYTTAYSATKSIMTLAQSPAVPTNIKKTATETSATISWGAVSGATGYNIQFNGTTYSVSGISKTFTGLTANKSYVFKVCAKNGSIIGSYSAEMTVKTAPGAPASVSAVSTEDTVKVSWSAVSGAVGYIVSFNGTKYGVPGTANLFTGLAANTSYSYQVCSKSVDGAGNYSGLRNIKTLVKALSTPTGITHKSTDNSVTISWNAVSGASGYDVMFLGETYSVTGTSKEFTGLTADKAYSYQVRSKASSGSVSSYSTVQTVRTTPKAPTSTSPITSENSVTVSWSAVTGATGYDLLFNGKVYHVTGTSHTVTGLTANTSYTYQVRVNNADGSSAYGSAKTVKTAPTPPASPTVTTTKNSVTVSWNAVAGATSYDILLNDNIFRVTGTSKTITGLTPGTSYTYQVRSNNADGSSTYCASKSVSTLPNPPAAPANVNATSTVNSVTVTWNAVSGATSYDVLLGNKTYNVTGTSKTVTGLNSDASYIYQVRANNAGGNGVYSAIQTIKTLVKAPAVPTNVRATPHHSQLGCGNRGNELLFTV